MTTVTPGAVELKPCPFCGGEARSRDYGRGRVGVQCSEPDCRASSMLSLPGEDAIAAWNRRATPPDALQTVVEAWQPIESAPKMREVLLWADTSTPDFPNWRMASGYFHTGMNVWIWGGEQVREWAFPPTHWQPLPKPPSLAGGDL